MYMLKKLDIIYEDNDILLCHKPAGIATQTKRLGQPDMESLLKNYRVKKGEPPYIGIVHRLDQPVEGIMIFAKNQKSTATLSKQVQQRIIGKYYYAISDDTPIEPQGILENYLLTDKKTNVTIVTDETDVSQVKNANLIPNQVSDENKNLVGTAHSKRQGSESQSVSKDAKYAKLEYKVLKTKENKTLFDIKLHTGRQHQIRVQMAHMGCPLVGDNKYGKNALKPDTRVVNHAQTSADKMELNLCSYRLEFEHPTTRKKMQFSIVPKGIGFQLFF